MVGAGGRCSPDRARCSRWARPLRGAGGASAAFAVAGHPLGRATGVDMLFGSPLTALSLLGPSPGLGARFFGIGNELEATIGAMLPLGAGAAVTAPRRRPIRAARVAIAAAARRRRRRRRVRARAASAPTSGPRSPSRRPPPRVVVALRSDSAAARGCSWSPRPVAALAALVALRSGQRGDSHLSRSVSRAGGLDRASARSSSAGSGSARGSFPAILHSGFFVDGAGRDRRRRSSPASACFAWYGALPGGVRRASSAGPSPRGRRHPRQRFWRALLLIGTALLARLRRAVLVRRIRHDWDATHG